MALFLRKLKEQPKKVLVARTDRIGDFVLTLPVLEVLRKSGIAPSVLCRSLVTPLLENNPFVDSIIAVDSPGSDPLDEIRPQEFDCLLVLVNDPIIRGLLPRLKDIPVRIGPLSKPSVFFSYTHPVFQKRSRSLMNEAEYNLELLEVLNLKSIDPARPKIYFRPGEIQGFRER
jgi:ADP-heptose:LPS heptosyltransferase